MREHVWPAFAIIFTVNDVVAFTQGRPVGMAALVVSAVLAAAIWGAQRRRWLDPDGPR